MPPKKEKVEKTSVEAGTALVLEYLKQQNRPYSAIEISANLHNKVTKAQAAKILKDLAETKQIASKASGKQSVYHAIQDPKDNLTAEELSQLDAEITDLRAELVRLKDEEKASKSELASLKATVTMAELAITSTTLKMEQEKLKTRLDDLKSGTIKAVSAEEKLEVEKNLKLWTYKAQGRKKSCMNLWAIISDNTPEGKTKEEFWEEIGLEKPEEV